MKKLIAILLAALTCAAVFPGCEGGKDESSLPEETSEVSQAENQKIAKINACLGEEVDSKLNAINLFEDMDYTIATPTSDAYPNGNNKLTDGATREVFDKQSFVGWGNGSSAIITFDMGTADHGISEIVVSTLRMIDYGIGTPKYVSLRVSDDDETYIEVCKLSMPIDLPDSACYDFVLSLPKTIKARYIRIQCAASDKSFIFIDEIFGYKYSEHGNI
ncbi:MAG: discoidin domain-containing protein, partial [Clostridiales bacterium]|nr:discoidin domain-containing protein [Candidatus Coliplasma equi]